MFSYAMIFYITKFYDKKELYNSCDANPNISNCNTRTFYWYLAWTYEYAFGNWDETPSPKNDRYNYVYIFHLLLTYFVTILMVNTLIAIAGNTYDRVDDEIDRLNILENTEMIIESIDYDILELKIKNLFKINHDEICGATEKDQFFYLSLKKKDKEDSKRKNDEN